MTFSRASRIFAFLSLSAISSAFVRAKDDAPDAQQIFRHMTQLLNNAPLLYNEEQRQERGGTMSIATWAKHTDKGQTIIRVEKTLVTGTHQLAMAATLTNQEGMWSLFPEAKTAVLSPTPVSTSAGFIVPTTTQKPPLEDAVGDVRVNDKDCWLITLIQKPGNPGDMGAVTLRCTYAIDKNTNLPAELTVYSVGSNKTMLHTSWKTFKLLSEADDSIFAVPSDYKVLMPDSAYEYGRQIATLEKTRAYNAFKKK